MRGGSWSWSALVLAVAVGSMDTLQALLPEVDEIVCLA